MTKFLRVYLPALLLALLVHFSASAQNCTINAGSDRTICPGQPFTLIGAATGLFAQQAKWTQIAGPAVTISPTTIAPDGTPTANVTGFSKGVNYTFRLSAKCTDGSPVSDDAVYNVSTLTVANAGPDIVSCPGVITMHANAVKTGETGVWSVESGNLSVPAPATDPNATVTLHTSGPDVGISILKWTITDAAGNCVTSSTVKVTNRGGEAPVTASSPLSVSCYSVTGSTQLDASYGGIGNGQIGTWTFLSGPNTPVIGDIHAKNTSIANLIAGQYKLRWTVVGACAMGTADVVINVEPASQSVTQVGSPFMTYCDGRPSTILEGVKPLYANETVKWTVATDPAHPTVPINPTATTFSDENSPTTVVSGMNGTGDYDFVYTITNNVTGCAAQGVYHVRYTTAPTITITTTSPLVLGCNASQFDIHYTVAGGNGTQWALVSAPTGSTVEDSIFHGQNVYTRASDDIQPVVGLNKVGTYVFRFRRYNNQAAGGCVDNYADISVIVSKGPYQANAGTPQLLACMTTSATLAGNAPQPGDAGAGQWSQVSGPNPAIIADKNLNTTGISSLISGVYVFRWIVTGGNTDCGDSQSDVKVVIASTPVMANAGADIGVCFGTPVKMDANQPLLNETGTWSVFSEDPASPASTVTFSDIHDPHAIVDGLLANKIYTLRWLISNVCGTKDDDVQINTNSTSGPKQAVAGTDQCLASGITTFNLGGSAPLTDETGTWAMVSGPNTPAFTLHDNIQTVTGAINGTYVFEWKMDKGTCAPTRDTVMITISGPTTVAVIPDPSSINQCDLQPIHLSANAPAATETGTWAQVGGPGGATIDNPHSNTAIVSGLVEGRYKFSWTITNNACASSADTVTYNVSDVPTPATVGPTQTLCDTSSTTLTGNVVTVGNGLWKVIDGPGTPVFSDIGDPHAIISGLKIGTYHLSWTITNNPLCPSSAANITITVGQSAHAGPDQALCNTSTTVLVGNEGSRGTWTEVTTHGAVLTPTSANTNSYIATGLLPNTSYVFRYTIDATHGGCGTLTDDINVVVSGPPSTANAGADKELCTSSGSAVDLIAINPEDPNPLIGTGAWSIVSGPPGGVAALNAVANPLQSHVTGLTVPGIYLFQWTVSRDNCTGAQSSNDIVRVTVYAPPTAALPMDPQPAACKDGVVLTGTTPIVGTGTWTMDSGPTTAVFDAPNSPTTTVSGLLVSTTPYVFRWTIANGICTSSAQTVSVTVKDNSPAIAAAGPAQSLCTGTIGAAITATLAGNAVSTGNDQGTWTVTNQPASTPTVTFDDVHSNVAVASGLKAGVYTFRWTIGNQSGCKSTSDVAITVYDPPSPADAGGTSASYCLFSPVVLNAVAPTSGTGTWSTTSKPTGAGDPVFSSENDNHATVTGLELGTYVFTWTTSNGVLCSTTHSDITVTIQDCQVAVAKEAPGTPVQQTDGSFDVTFLFHVKNTGNAAMSGVQVADDLVTTTFPAPKTFTIKSLSASGSNLTVDHSFNGSSNQNMLVASSSSMAAGATETITLVVNVKLK